jgi:hypothetical protein
MSKGVRAGAMSLVKLDWLEIAGFGHTADIPLVASVARR